jgi:hypothetical protein
MEQPHSNDEVLLRRAEFLHLACRDLWDVGICVDYLLDTGSAVLNSRVRLVLESGMLVTYVRCFSGKSGQIISPTSDLSPQLRSLHEHIILRRNKVYAHTDHTEYRQITDFRSDCAAAVFMAGDDASTVREEWDYLSDEGLFSLGQLARVHYTQSHSELDRLRATTRE